MKQNTEAYRDLGFDQAVGDKAFEQLVLARIVEPASKLKTVAILDGLGVESFHRNTFAACLRRCVERDCRSRLSAACFAHAMAGGDLSLALYDVTTLYFEAGKEDEETGPNQGLRRVGYSKERRVDPQVVVGLLVDRAGFPLEVAMFEGDKAETKTIVPVLRRFAQRDKVADFVVTADAGMLSRENLLALEAEGFRFIVGARQSRAPLDLEPVLDGDGWDFADGQLVDTIAPIHAATKIAPAERARPWRPDGRSWRTVWAWSAKRARRDRATLAAQRERALAIADGTRKQKRPASSARAIRAPSSTRRPSSAPNAWPA